MGQVYGLWPSVLHDQLNQIPTSKSLTVVPWMTSRINFKMYAMSTTFQSSGKVAAPFVTQSAAQLLHA